MLFIQATLSREEQLQSMRDRFEREDPNAGVTIMLMFTLVAALFGIIWLLHRWQVNRDKGSVPQPMTLYLRIQRKLGLALTQRWRLWRLARTVRIAHPTAMLISPRLFDAAVKRYCTRGGLLGARPGAASAFADIRKRLFGQNTP